MKRLFTTLSLLAVAGLSYAQTTATNFTATDCNGNSHTLFTDLDAGKTVVMVWVMPCGACAPATTAAFTATQKFATAHPGQVLYYLISDYGDDSCSTLQAFATANGADLSKISVFNNAGNVIKQADYGGNGMPHVVVASGTDHKIWYNEKNGQAAGIVDALNKATGVDDISKSFSFSMSPNPVTGTLKITYAKAIVNVTVLSLSGQVVKEVSFGKGQMNPSVDLSGIAAGSYMIKVQDAEGRNGLQQVSKL
jgi:hypothetical protein